MQFLDDIHALVSVSVLLVFCLCLSVSPSCGVFIFSAPHQELHGRYLECRLNSEFSKVLRTVFMYLKNKIDMVIEQH